MPPLTITLDRLTPEQVTFAMGEDGNVTATFYGAIHTADGEYSKRVTHSLPLSPVRQTQFNTAWGDAVNYVKGLWGIT